MVNQLTRENFEKVIKENSIVVVEFYSATCKHCKKLEAGIAELSEEAGNEVEVHRIKDALHGFFALGIRFLHVQESFEIMNKFLEKEADKTWKQDIQNGEN